MFGGKELVLLMQYMNPGCNVKTPWMVVAMVNVTQNQKSYNNDVVDGVTTKLALT